MLWQTNGVKMFNDFYKIYPRKMARKDAEKAWAKLTFEEQTMALEAITLHKQYWEATNTEKQYIPYPASWLNGQRFYDELEIPEQKIKELPLGTDQQIEEAYRIECGGDPQRSRFNSYFEMKKFVLDQRDRRAKI
jgi:hypothetical protein